MKMSVQVSGPLIKPSVLRKLGEDMQAKLVREAKLAANDVANNSRTAIENEGTGRVYVRGSVTRRASAPGHPPSTDRGGLIASIQVRRDGDGWLVGSLLKYSVWLEYGTSTMSERPFFRPALKKAQAKWIERVRNLVGGKNVRLQDAIE